MANQEEVTATAPVEKKSPDGRYIRLDEKLGFGAYKNVWKAYDAENGREVAWNMVDLRKLPESEKHRIKSETALLKTLKHPHIINFLDTWHDTTKEQICFTTEIMTSGTLKQYVDRIFKHGRGVKLKIIKKWCRQILEALSYLHSKNPPVIHRDLKCDNIFINGNTSEIRIGDFGLSAARSNTYVQSVLGTPEFMAPELYDENYTEKVDMYAFGMCVLEMTTNEYPYQECRNAAQIFKRVSVDKKKPAVLDRIADDQVRAFVELCLAPAELRLSAADLLRHPFLSERDPIRDREIVEILPATEITITLPVAAQHSESESDSDDDDDEYDSAPVTVVRSTGGEPGKEDPNTKPGDAESPKLPPSGSKNIEVWDVASPSNSPTSRSPVPESEYRVTSVEVTASPTDLDNVCKIQLVIHIYGAKNAKKVGFDYHCNEDTPESVAWDMVNELALPNPEETKNLVANKIGCAVLGLLSPTSNPNLPPPIVADRSPLTQESTPTPKGPTGVRTLDDTDIQIPTQPQKYPTQQPQHESVADLSTSQLKEEFTALGGSMPTYAVEKTWLQEQVIELRARHSKADKSMADLAAAAGKRETSSSNSVNVPPIRPAPDNDAQRCKSTESINRPAAGSTDVGVTDPARSVSPITLPSPVAGTDSRSTVKAALANGIPLKPQSKPPQKTQSKPPQKTQSKPPQKTQSKPQQTKPPQKPAPRAHSKPKPATDSILEHDRGIPGLNMSQLAAKFKEDEAKHLELRNVTLKDIEEAEARLRSLRGKLDMIDSKWKEESARQKSQLNERMTLVQHQAENHTTAPKTSVTQSASREQLPNGNGSHKKVERKGDDVKQRLAKQRTAEAADTEQRLLQSLGLSLTTAKAPPHQPTSQPRAQGGLP